MENQTNEQVQSAETPQEEMVSRPNHLRLRQVEVESYAGLDFHDKALVIAFDHDKRIIELEGDQGVGKTSLMACMKTLMGLPEPANAINSKTAGKTASFTFEKNGEVYNVRSTKKSFTMSSVKEIDGKVVKSSINSPKDILATLIGPIGVSPDFLSKKKSGEDQIEWIKSMGSSTTSTSKMEEEANKSYETSYKERTAVNATVKRLAGELLASGYYTKAKDSDDMLTTVKIAIDLKKVSDAPANAEEIKTAFQLALNDKEQYDRTIIWQAGAVTKKDALSNERQQILDKIAALQGQLVVKDNEILEHAALYERSEAKVKELEGATDKYLKAQEDMQNTGAIALLKRDIDDSENKIEKYNEAIADQTRLNDKLVEIEKLRKQIAKEFTPNIPGLEVEIGGNIDNTRPLGVYYNGTNMAFLSESEQWDLCLQAWKHFGTNVVYIENSTSLGTNAIERINWFAQNGGNVFMSTMARGYKELKVTLHETIK